MKDKLILLLFSLYSAFWFLLIGVAGIEGLAGHK